LYQPILRSKGAGICMGDQSSYPFIALAIMKLYSSIHA
jgi:hypothetical protein